MSHNNFNTTIMPTAKSAKKELRKRDKLTRHNVAIKKAMKEEIKAIEQLSSENKKDEATKHNITLQKKVDKATKLNVIEKNKANRIKSRMTKKVTNIK